MEEKPLSGAITTVKTWLTMQKFAMEGEKRLEETVHAAFLIISAINDELCNPTLWSTSAANQTAAQTDAAADGGGHLTEGGDSELDEARLLYKNSVASLRAVLAVIPTLRKAKASQALVDSRSAMSEDEVEKFEERASSLRKVASVSFGFGFLFVYKSTPPLHDFLADAKSAAYRGPDLHPTNWYWRLQTRMSKSRR